MTQNCGCLLAAAVTALLAAGCGLNGPRSVQGTTETGSSVRSSSAPGESDRRDPAPPGTITTRPPVLPVAADGTDLAGCRDARCEVEVRAGDRFSLDPEWGVEVIGIDSVAGGSEEDEEIRLELQGSSGGFDLEGLSVTASSTCVNGDCQDVGALTLVVGEPGRINEIEVRLEGVAADRAVLALLPA